MTTYVYFIRSLDRVKIGFSADPSSRLMKINADSPHECELLGTIEGDEGVERGLHDRFAAYRVKGEWFLAVPEILDLIAAQTIAAASDVPLPQPPRIGDAMTAADVRAIRASFGETQIAFSKRVGVTPLTVSDWERNGPPSQGAARHLLISLSAGEA